ncbi:hypothetical protein CEXT_669931 [Caerostris extrusa]|uniref:Uncharacterized protein n=1 Tax=Caerostris extrusa TaxID=172846 RepID=A0AAV4MTR0_CAEEX|nr:hypothetical protein CEXT_669931 [Caerostris extrusa]
MDIDCSEFNDSSKAGSLQIESTTLSSTLNTSKRLLEALNEMLKDIPCDKTKTKDTSLNITQRESNLCDKMEVDIFEGDS